MPARSGGLGLPTVVCRDGRAATRDQVPRLLGRRAGRQRRSPLPRRQQRRRTMPRRSSDSDPAARTRHRLRRRRPGGLSLSSGSVSSAHADFWNTWDQHKLETEVELCVRRQSAASAAAASTSLVRSLRSLSPFGRARGRCRTGGGPASWPFAAGEGASAPSRTPDGVYRDTIPTGQTLRMAARRQPTAELAGTTTATGASASRWGCARTTRSSRGCGGPPRRAESSWAAVPSTRASR